MKTMKKIYVALAAATCLSVGVAVSALKTPVQASAQGYANDSFAILQAASVRKAENHGIRFRTVIGNDTLTSWGENYTMGTLILPENIYEKAGKELTVDYSYKIAGVVYKPAVASIDGDETRLVTLDGYDNCKFFNAVLDLSDISVTYPDFLMQNLVARSFVTVDGVTTYADDIVVRSAAYVGASALDEGETDTKGVLSNYVQGLESVSFGSSNLNVAVGAANKLEATVKPAGVFPVKYAASNGVIEGDTYTITQEGAATITASVAGGKKSATVNINAVSDRDLTRKYYEESDCYTYNVYDVTEVKYGGRTLREGQEYTQNGAEINVEKNVLCSTAEQVNELEFVSAASGTVKVNVTVSYDDGLLSQSLKGYSASNGRFGYSAYASIGSNNRTQDADGVAGGTINDITTNIDYISEAYLADYFDSGLKLVLPQTAAQIGAGAFEGSNLEKVMDIAHNLGYDNSVIVTDGQLIEPYRDAAVYDHAYYKDVTDFDAIKLIVPGTTNSELFQSEEDLEQYMYDCLKRYSQHPAFGGVMLPDEPACKYLGIIGEMYHAVENALARLKSEGKLSAGEKVLHENLLPYTESLARAGSYSKTSTDLGYGKYQEQHQEYRDYLQLYFDKTGAKTVMSDIYSYYTQTYRYHILGLQITAEVARENGAQVATITSTLHRPTADERYHDAAALNWFNNLNMGMGIKDVGFYTYHVKNDSAWVDSKGNPAGEIHMNDGSFINRQGEKTELYYNVKTMLAKSQVLAPVITNFDYNASAMFNNGCSYRENDNFTDGPHDVFWAVDTYEKKSETQRFNTSVIKKNSSGQFLTMGEGFMGILTELKDSATGNYMYMVMNTIPPYNTASTATTSASIRFQSSYTHAWVYFDGNFTVRSLDSNNGLTFTMNPGEAYYVIPFAQDPYLVDFEKGANTALVGDNVAGKSYFYGSVQTVDGNACYCWNRNADKTEGTFYFSNTAAGNWLDNVRADDTVDSISFDVKAGAKDAGKTPTTVYFCQWKAPKYYAKGVEKGNGWVTFTIPKTYLKDMGNSGEYWMKIWYDEAMTDAPTALYFDNFRVNYA